MKLRYLPSPEVPDLLLREMIEFRLAGFTPAPGQRLVSNDELLQMAGITLTEEHVELIRRSRVQVELV